MLLFAEVAELAAVLRISSPTAAQLTEMELALEVATGKIQSYTRQYLAAVADDVLRLRGNWSDTLWLPERIVTDVASITIDGLTLAPTLYNWAPNGSVLLWRNDSTIINAPTGWCGWWGGPGAVIEATYSHGFDPIPADVKGVCLALASRQVGQPDPSGQMIQRQIASYSEQFSRAPAQMLTEDEQQTLERYRRRQGYQTVPAA